MRLKSTLRQASNEASDLSFLNQQKDARIAALESELLKMRQKLDKVQSKLYMPSQDQIIGGMNSAGQPHNIIRGAAQNFEMNRPLEHNFDGEGEESPHTTNMRDQEWAIELRKADERSHEIRLRCEDFVKKNQILEEKNK